MLFRLIVILGMKASGYFFTFGYIHSIFKEGFLDFKILYEFIIQFLFAENDLPECLLPV